LHCAENPMRDMFVGAGGKGLAAMGYYSPRMTDKYMEKTQFEQQMRDEPETPRPNGLYEPTNDPRERGPYPGYVMENSYYTKASMHPMMTGALMLAVGLAASQFVRSRRQTREEVF
jgi:hypothetical protein